MSNIRLKHQTITSLRQVDANNLQDDGGDYIFDIEISCNNALVLASVSDMHVNIYDSSTFSTVGKVQVHEGKINCLESSTFDPNIFFTGSDDRSVKIWDMRSLPVPIGSNHMLDDVSGVSCGLDGWLMAAGCGTAINFYDLRMNSSGGIRKLGEYSDIHTDMITQIKFHPLRSTILTSAAEDGLICIYDTSVAAEEEAVMSILNTECPVRRYGFFGDNLEGLYSLSTVETASIWHFNSAQRISDFPNIRETTGADYLVDCLYDPTSADRDALNLLVGKYDGLGYVVNVEPNDLVPTSVRLTGGHIATIRCAKMFSRSTGGLSPLIITGGEDARLNVWESISESTAPAVSSATAVSRNNHRSRDNSSGSRGKKDAYLPSPY
jgi:WD40 repeat protein